MRKINLSALKTESDFDFFYGKDLSSIKGGTGNFNSSSETTVPASSDPNNTLPGYTLAVHTVMGKAGDFYANNQAATYSYGSWWSAGLSTTSNFGQQQMENYVDGVLEDPSYATMATEFFTSFFADPTNLQYMNTAVQLALGNMQGVTVEVTASSGNMIKFNNSVFSQQESTDLFRNANNVMYSQFFKQGIFEIDMQNSTFHLNQDKYDATMEYLSGGNTYDDFLTWAEGGGLDNW